MPRDQINDALRQSRLMNKDRGERTWKWFRWQIGTFAAGYCGADAIVRVHLFGGTRFLTFVVISARAMPEYWGQYTGLRSWQLLTEHIIKPIDELEGRRPPDKGLQTLAERGLEILVPS